MKAPFKTTILILLATILPTFGCIPNLIIPEYAVVDVASLITINPRITCEDLKSAFGVPYLPTVDSPDEIGLNYVETTITTDDDETLTVWYLPSEMDRGTVIISMGSTGDISCFLFMAYMLQSNGWNAVLYEYSGFKRSTGTPNMRNLYTDLDAAIDWTLENTDADQVTLLGVSLGTMPTAAHAADRPNEVNAVILDGPVSIEDELDRLAWVFFYQTDGYLGQFDDEVLLTRQIPRIAQPILAVLYGHDEFATSAAISETLDQAQGEVRTLWFGDLAHARGPYMESATYFFEVNQFLTDVWSSPPYEHPVE